MHTLQLQKPTAYNRVADVLRADIQKGKYPVAQKLPTEHELCKMFNASRITIRKALEILEQQAFVIRRQGQGTFVSPQQPLKQPQSITHAMADTSVGITAKYQMLAMYWADASPQVVSDLHHKVLRVLSIRRLARDQGRVCVYQSIKIARDAAMRLREADFLETDFLRHWQSRQGIMLSQIDQTIVMEPAPSELAHEMGIPVGEPLFREKLIIAGSSMPLARILSYYPADLVQFTCTAHLTPVY